MKKRIYHHLYDNISQVKHKPKNKLQINSHELCSLNHFAKDKGRKFTKLPPDWRQKDFDSSVGACYCLCPFRPVFSFILFSPFREEHVALPVFKPPWGWAMWQSESKGTHIAHKSWANQRHSNFNSLNSLFSHLVRSPLASYQSQVLLAWASQSQMIVSHLFPFIFCLELCWNFLAI